MSFSQSDVVLFAVVSAAGYASGIAVGLAYFRPKEAVLDAKLAAEQKAERVGILDAIHLSAEKHRNHRGPTRTRAPSVSHYLRVAEILSGHDVRDISVLQASILLGTITEAGTSPYELRYKFGNKVADIVEELTVDRTVPVYCAGSRTKQGLCCSRTNL